MLNHGLRTDVREFSNTHVKSTSSSKNYRQLGDSIENK